MLFIADKTKSMSDSQCSSKVGMSEEQCNNWVEVNRDFWKSDYMKILDSGVPLFYVGNSSERDNTITAMCCAEPEIYSHPSMIRLLKSSPELHKKTAPYVMGKACRSSDIETMKELLHGGLVDINDEFLFIGETPLMYATIHNQASIVSMLLTHNNLVLDKAREEDGATALHLACNYKGTSFPIISLFGSDSRCTPAVLNKKDDYGDSPLMWAVIHGNLECIKEMDKLHGTDFRTVNRHGEGLLDVARGRIRKQSRKEDHEAVLEYLLNRRKIESLKELSAHAVASLLTCDADVEQLELPLVLHPWVTGYLHTSPNPNRLLDSDEMMTDSDDPSDSSGDDSSSDSSSEDSSSDSSSEDSSDSSSDMDGGFLDGIGQDEKMM